MKLLAMIVIVALFSGAVALSAEVTSVDKVPRMTKEQVLPLLGKDNVVVYDVRKVGDWKESRTKIKGAIRLEMADTKAAMEKTPKDKTLIFYCA